MRQEVFELHSLLKAAEVAPPYILVGHSIGGLLVRLYTAEYPKDVLGLVLVDATHENTWLYARRRGESEGKWVRPREGAKDRAIPPVQATMTTSTSPTWNEYWPEELQQMYESRKKTPEPLGDPPLIVLAAGRPPTRLPDTSTDLWNEIQREIYDQRGDLARLSRNSKLVRDPSSGHHLHIDNPELVAWSIATQPEPKRSDMQELHRIILEVMPKCKLWFLDGKDDEGRTVSNPNIGYGFQNIEYADGKTREFYQVGISATQRESLSISLV
jgi:pimeloyl-ACP methyl ester carboxylesterase